MGAQQIAARPVGTNIRPHVARRHGGDIHKDPGARADTEAGQGALRHAWPCQCSMITDGAVVPLGEPPTQMSSADRALAEST
jgi:hypothetical protein